ncbi:MAG: hypothetical protein KJO98_11390, partial [Rhodothermia bacterium]|nr:hypothetical protein [Rhodothermia bacterium]
MRSATISILLVAFAILGATAPYPLDGFDYTGIRRLLKTQLVAEGKLPGRKPPQGAMKTFGEISLTLPGRASEPLSELPAPDQSLTAKLTRLFPGRDASYSVAIIDITPGREHRLAFHKEKNRYQPGSVGKLAILAGLFSELHRIFPSDTDARRQLLKNRMVTAGPWVRSNHHTIPVYDPATRRFSSRAVMESDTFSLYEWADHAVSASSNAAASVLWKEVVLMRA